MSESKPKPESKFTPFSPGTLDSGGDEGKKEPVVDQSEAPVEQVEPAVPDQQETLALTESSAPAESTELDQSKLPAAPEALAKNEVMTEVGQLIDDAGDLISLLKTLKSNIDTLDSNQARDELNDAQNSLATIVQTKSAIFGKIRNLGDSAQIEGEVVKIFTNELDDLIILIKEILAEISTSASAESSASELAEPTPAEESQLELIKTYYESIQTQIETALAKIEEREQKIDQVVSRDGASAASPIDFRVNRAVAVYRNLADLDELDQLVGFNQELDGLLDDARGIVVTTADGGYAAKNSLVSEIGETKDRIASAQAFVKDAPLLIWRDGYKHLCPELDDRDSSAINAGTNKSFAHQLTELKAKAPDFVGMSEDELNLAKTELQTKMQLAEQTMKAVAKDHLMINDQEIVEIETWFKKGMGRDYEVLLGDIRNLSKEHKDVSRESHGTESETSLKGLSLFELLNEMETTEHLEVSDTIAFRNMIRREAEAISAIDGDWTEEERAGFVELCSDQVEPLIEFGVFTPKSINPTHVTVTKDATALIGDFANEQGGCLDGTSAGTAAITFNSRLNENVLVKADEADEEQYSSNMGIVQKICCVAYNLMATKGSQGNDGLISDPNYEGNDRQFTTFDRTDEFVAGQSKAMINYICSKDGVVVRDASGVEHVVDIASEVRRFPKEAVEILKYIALLKSSRDDLGQKASNKIMAFHGKSPKLLGTGSNATVWSAGYIPRSVYKSGQSSNNKEHMVFWAYANPSNIDCLDMTPDPNSHFEGMPKPTRDAEIFRKTRLCEAYFKYLRPSWPEKVWTEIAANPLKWDQDFPSIDDLTNRSDEKTAGSYGQSRHAYTNIITAAYKAPTIRLKIDRESMKKQIEDLLSNVFTWCAMMFAYIGTGEVDPDEPKQTDKYKRFHEIPKAAVKFIMANIVMGVPGETLQKEENFWYRVTTFGETNENEEIIQRKKEAVRIIREEILRYPSLGTLDEDREQSYAKEFIDFLDGDWLINHDYRTIDDKTIEYNMTRVKLNPHFPDMTSKERFNEYEQPVSMPFEPAKDSSD